MLFIERNEKGAIKAIRQGDYSPNREPISLLDEEVQEFLKQAGDIDTISNILTISDYPLIRVLEDLIDLLIAKNLIILTDLPEEAQQKIRERKRLRSKLSDSKLIVDDII